MASRSEVNPYRCDHCGTANIVAAPVLYQQETRSYSGLFYSGTTQSYSAQAIAPPRPRRYVRPILLWGPAIFLLTFWTLVGFRSVFEFHEATLLRTDLAVIFLLFDLISIAGLKYSLRKVSRYNRGVFPGLRWNWEHTYVCRRCGKFRLICS